MNYKIIDLNTYKRKDHFAHFMEMDDPFITMNVNVDITKLYNEAKGNNYPFFLYFQYFVIKAANSIPELRQRVRDGNIIEYDYCGSSYTVALEDGTYRYCNVMCNMPLNEYFGYAKQKQEEALKQANLVEEDDPESYFFVSCMPWHTYSSLEMPKPNNKFSVPSISWGKFFIENCVIENDDKITIEKHIKMPVTIMVNHALVDGKQVCDFFNELDRLIS